MLLPGINYLSFNQLSSLHAIRLHSHSSPLVQTPMCAQSWPQSHILCQHRLISTAFSLSPSLIFSNIIFWGCVTQPNELLGLIFKVINVLYYLHVAM